MRARQPLSDEQLVRATLGGCSEASDVFAERMVCIHRYLASSKAARSLGLAAVDDLAQEAVLRTWSTRARFDASSRLETWMIGISRMVLLEALRKRATERQRGAELVRERAHAIAGPLESDGDAPGSADLERVIDAVRDLPEADRKLLMDKLHGNRSFRELATEYGLPANTLKARYYRLIRSVRRRFGGDEGRTDGDARTPGIARRKRAR